MRSARWGEIFQILRGGHLVDYHVTVGGLGGRGRPGRCTADMWFVTRDMDGKAFEKAC